ncbi:four-carbon acid sugar kinase family protein [Amycolatopsis solani]|uniref:four-carbon acid sugar kinase family protein n=1 Tax=Amycolatopsis solani TaxID=3028615 RepID=UPI0025B1438F|nr:four-carbon acid sugar kinase family protein [Amycolatopsis sp. MEP2-6]
MATTAPRVLLLADDVSGAAEAAAAHGGPTLLRLSLGSDAAARAATVLALDLDSRADDAEAATAGLRAALAAHAADREVLVKIDSLLRGHLGAVVGELRSLGRPVVVAPALPVAGRTVRSGVVHVGGIPLHHTAAWAAEPRAAPDSVAAAVGLPARVLDLPVVRGPRLADEMLTAHRSGRVIVGDAERDDDLDALVAAARVAGATLVGAAGLAAAAGRAAAWPGRAESASENSGAPLLVVVGTAAPSAREQVRRLRDAGAAVVTVDAGASSVQARDELAAALRTGTAVLAVSPRFVGEARVSELLAALVREVLQGIAAPVDLALTGGETARRTLDALGISELRPLHQVHHGAVVSRAPDGRTVVTRPGSFGDPDSLVAIARSVRAGDLQNTNQDGPSEAGRAGQGGR